MRVIKKICLFIMLIAVCQINSSELSQRSGRNLRLLVLIIASEDLPVYSKLQEIWRSYMHYDTNRIQAYFIKGDQQLPGSVEIKDDVIWSKVEESIIPGILNKTIFSMEAILPFIHRFDYVLRTNLSSFYIFPRLLNYLETCSRTNFYCGSDMRGDGFLASGSGFILSSDLIELLVKHKKQFLNNSSSYDDVLLGKFLRERGVKLQIHDRMDFFSRDSWSQERVASAGSIFQFRIKNRDSLRLIDDVFIQTQLRDIFYGDRI